MGRLNNWSEILTSHIEEWRNKSFQWGKYDCAMFCLSAEKKMCGSSRFEDYLGIYSSASGSAKALIKLGRGKLSDSVSQRLPEISANEARRGDVGLISTPEGDALCLVVGDKVAAMGKNGLVFLAMDAVKKAWRV